MRIYNMSNEYTRPFIRSALPVHKISMALWTHPDLRRLKGLPTGYTHGIVWQDRYAAKRNFEGMRKFYSRSKMVEAYNMGRLSGIIGTDETIGEFDPLPEQAELLEDFKVYLYVGIEYADFMKKLSVALKP